MKTIHLLPILFALACASLADAGSNPTHGKSAPPDPQAIVGHAFLLNQISPQYGRLKDSRRDVLIHETQGG